jgi:hypothetical protein
MYLFILFDVLEHRKATPLMPYHKFLMGKDE